jgi:hypothetical protein
MIKVFRFWAICSIGVAFATSSIAWAQTYTAVNYPGAALTELIGGPNPQGTSVGGYTLTAGGALHGFTAQIEQGVAPLLVAEPMTEKGLRITSWSTEAQEWHSRFSIGRVGWT